MFQRCFAVLLITTAPSGLASVTEYDQVCGRRTVALRTAKGT